MFSKMRLLALTAALLFSTALSTSPSKDEAQLSRLAKQAYDQTFTYNHPGAYGQKHQKCSPKNIRVRRNYSHLSPSARKHYIASIQCLQSLPSQTPSSLSSGAKTRYDDFVATHINQTLTIHYTASFLSWHRYYIYAFENALRQECGFTGDLPYWDWSETARTGLQHSKLFDGSGTSLSGNGAAISGPQEDIMLGAAQGLPPIYLPTGSGGGCVESGPFAKMRVNLGPVSLDLPGGKVGGPPTGNPLDWNPRCLKRDLVDAINRRYANASSMLNLITRSESVGDFQLSMQGVPGSGDIGVHGGGHYSLGGDPGRDVFVSPGDPAFWTHHGGIDRMW